MSTTAREVIRGALKLIGVVAAGENPSAQEQSDALIALNDMLDLWSTQSLLVYSKTIETLALISGQQTYTMGTGGDLDTTRPLKIEHIATRDNASTPANEIPIQIINFDQWANITQKLTQSTLSSKVYVDYSNPLITLNFWPVPSQSNGLVIYSWKPLSSLASASATVDLPPGYAMALRYNLAVILAPEYGRPLDPTVASIAATTVADIQRMNIQPIYMSCDQAVISSGKTWDWRTGE